MVICWTVHKKYACFYELWKHDYVIIRSQKCKAAWMTAKQSFQVSGEVYLRVVWKVKSVLMLEWMNCQVKQEDKNAPRWRYDDRCKSWRIREIETCFAITGVYQVLSKN